MIRTPMIRTPLGGVLLPYLSHLSVTYLSQTQTTLATCGAHTPRGSHVECHRPTGISRSRFNIPIMHNSTLSLICQIVSRSPPAIVAGTRYVRAHSRPRWHKQQ